MLTRHVIVPYKGKYFVVVVVSSDAKGKEILPAMGKEILPAKGIFKCSLTASVWVH